MVKKKYYIKPIPVSHNTDSYAAKPLKNVFCPCRCGTDCAKGDVNLSE
jgi:hypothetical protein